MATFVHNRPKLSNRFVVSFVVLGESADYLAPSIKRLAPADNDSTGAPVGMRPVATARAEIYFRCEHGTDYCIVIEDGKPTAILTGEKVRPSQEH